MSMNYEGTPGDYTYSQNSNGKSVSGILAVGPQSERDSNAQKSAGGVDRQPGDHGGHLMAHSLGGRNDPTNIDAQAANANQRDQAHVERNVANLASNPNNIVAMEVSNFNTNSQRPDATMINVGVLDTTTGKTDEQHISFQNESHELQQSWNDTVNQLDGTIDSRQDIGMTVEERELANEYCGKEDNVDNSLGSGWSHTDFDTSFLDGGEVSAETMESSSESEINDVSDNVSDDMSSDNDEMDDNDGLGE